MKKKMLILCSLITLLLAAFQFPVFADEDSSDPSSSVPTSVLNLTSEFYDDYVLLPYVQSTNRSQVVDTGINGSSEQKITCKFSYTDSSAGNVFISQDSSYRNSLYVWVTNKQYNLYFNNGNNVSNNFSSGSYIINNFVADKNVYYLDNYSYIFPESDFTIENTIKLFNTRFMKIYSFSIYDYSADSGNGAYVRYYYPAQRKVDNVIGFYDAVNKSFVTTSGADPFTNPTESNVMSFQIGNFITSSLSWIGDILTFAVETPIILVFMAIGLAGVMFRWGRRLVHF